ncbi:Uncharacterized protein dnm_081960 [Desulfonema magnum]|uniref:Uncharacterized protein n=1 Tax=Desulfonema magnum TaxID=45655 RepID=A0A975BUQ8_9BACT|nr:Uncharacterized protein dnm_081960 [Desulfonema magnum]
MEGIYNIHSSCFFNTFRFCQSDWSSRLRKISTNSEFRCTLTRQGMLFF